MLSRTFVVIVVEMQLRENGMGLERACQLFRLLLDRCVIGGALSRKRRCIIKEEEENLNGMSLEGRLSRKERRISGRDCQRLWGIGKSSNGGGVSYNVDATQRSL